MRAKGSLEAVQGGEHGNVGSVGAKDAGEFAVGIEGVLTRHPPSRL